VPAPRAPRRPALTSALAAALLAAGCLTLARLAADTAVPKTFESDVGPVLESSCLACHDAKTHAGGLVVEGLADGARVREKVDVWRKVRARVAAREMPPPASRERKDVPTLAAADKERFLAAIDAALAAVAPPVVPGDPGRVTMRRLNRMEYHATIRDLLGIDEHASEGFPSDDVGSGFDRIGDVLSMPPLLLEKYADAAEKIAEAAIPDPARTAPVRRFEAEKLEFERTQASVESGFVNFFTDGAALGEVRLPRDGTYEIRARAFADQAGPELARLAWRVGDVEIEGVSVKATRARPEVVARRFRGVAGVRSFSFAFVNDYYDPKNPNAAQRDRNLHVDWIEIVGPLDAPADAALDVPASQRRVFANDPGGGDVAARARAILAPLASRAWRRPASGAELDALVGLVTTEVGAKATFPGAVRTALEAILTSPHFLFHVEVMGRPDDPRAIQPLNDFALAARLSYFLWSSLPDEALLARARAGTLRAALGAEVRRMLADPRAGSLVDGFAEQWLTLRRLATIVPDKDRFPAFDARLREDMLRETQMFFEAVMTEDRSILDFVDGPFTFVNERLARHYGIEGVSGERFRRVALDGARRGGIFTQASVLMVTSLPTRTSPVRRGKWLLEQVLGTPVPPPPPGAGDLSEAESATKAASLRVRTERHRKDPACASCHRALDPLGFGLENYDAIGAWRDKDGEFAIDASGTLPDGRSFASPTGLRALVRADPGFPRCFAEKLFVYALGRGLTEADAPMIAGIVEGAAAGGHRFSAYVEGVVTSATFTSARGEEAGR